jgi:hypothetical protein
MPAYVGNPLAGDPIWEASSASELRIAITTKQVSRAGHPSDLLLARSRTRRPLSCASAANTAITDRADHPSRQPPLDSPPES